jgi:hypothetical protein
MKNLPDLSGFVGASGRPIVVGNKPAFVGKPRIAREGPAAFHKGFTVVGFTREQVDQAARDAWAAIRAWDEMPDKKKTGRERPPAWDEEKFLQSPKAPRINKKPYGTASAAEACAELATKQGLLGVRIIELSKGEQPQQEAFA